MMHLLRDGEWLTPQRLKAWTIILLVMEVLTCVILALGMHGWIVPLDHETGTDYNSFYAAGSLVLDGRWLSVYSQEAHRMAEWAIYGGKEVSYNFFFYPPPMLLLVTPFALLPYLPSFYLWTTLQAVFFLLGIRQTLGRDHSLLPYVAFPSAIIAYAIGQNALLTAGLLCWAMYFLSRRREVLAGVMIGCLCYKPHLALMIPLALMAGRHWRAFLSAAVTVLVIVALTTILFSPEIWLAWMELFRHTPDAFESGRIPPSGLVSPFASVLLLGGSIKVAYIIQGIFTIGSGLMIWRLWRDGDWAVKVMSLMGGVVLSIPVILIYDLLPTAIAYAWLSREARKTSWLPWEKSFALMVVGISLFSRPIAMGLHIPTAPLIGMTIMYFAWRRWKSPKPLPTPHY